MTQHEQRTLLITGASRGIGAACALACARDGWDVAVNYTRDAAAAGLDEDLVGAVDGGDRDHARVRRRIQRRC